LRTAIVRLPAGPVNHASLFVEPTTSPPVSDERNNTTPEPLRPVGCWLGEEKLDE